MGDTVDGFRALKAVQQLDRAQNRESAPKQLGAAGIKFTAFNDGAHIRIHAREVISTSGQELDGGRFLGAIDRNTVSSL